MAGLDYDDLSYMDEGERREAFEDAGLDLDDCDFWLVLIAMSFWNKKNDFTSNLYLV